MIDPSRDNRHEEIARAMNVPRLHHASMLRGHWSLVVLVCVLLIVTLATETLLPTQHRHQDQPTAHRSFRI